MPTATDKPAYREPARAIERAILRGIWQVGRTVWSVQEICGRFATSRITAMRVLY